MTLDTGFLGKSAQISEREREIVRKRKSHGVEARMLSIGSDNLSLDFKKKVLKQQLIDHEIMFANINSASLVEVASDVEP